MAHKMKHSKGERLNLRFNRKINLEFHGARLTSDGGLLACRELDEALGLFNLASDVMNDRRTGRNIQHDIANLLRLSVYSRLAGYEDVNDAERFSLDPVMKAVTGKKKKKNAASINTIGHFETEILTLKENIDSLSEINGRWVEKAIERTPNSPIILDMDSLKSPGHGVQEGSAYNGHFKCNCYHLLFCFKQHGESKGAMFRPGNVHSAGRWKELLEPIVRRYENKKVRKYFRGDAAFAQPEIYEHLEKKGLLYAILLPANDVLYDEIKHLLTCPVGRPSRKPVVWFHDFKYKAAIWKKRRHVVAKIEWHSGELFPRVGFFVTNMIPKAESACETYKDRSKGSKTQMLCFFPNGRGCHKKGYIRLITIQDQWITMLFKTMSRFPIRSEGQVSLIVIFFAKSGETQKK